MVCTKNSCPPYRHGCLLYFNHSGTLSLSLDSKFAATFGPLKHFEVHELKSGAIQNMQWKPSIDPTELGTQHNLAKSQPVCFAHEGFAVAGAAGGNSVYVWDAECGDQILSLDHGGEFPKH
jgi:hypothetical protein